MICPSCGVEWAPRKPNPVKCPRCWTHLKPPTMAELHAAHAEVKRAGKEPNVIVSAKRAKAKKVHADLMSMDNPVARQAVGLAVEAAMPSSRPKHAEGCTCWMCKPTK